MDKHVIFLIHGMGDYAGGWSDNIAKTIRSAYGGYSVSQLLPFDELFVVKPITYNDRFDALREKWESSAKEVLALMQPGRSGAGAIAEMTAWAAGANRDTFLRTHVLDVLLYRFCPTVADQVRAAVRLQILEGIAGVPRWSVIAHSLGTSVIHDTLVWMFDPAAQEALPPQGFRMETLAMVANVSRLLESKEFGARWDVYRSVVQPNVKVTKGVCTSFLNICHNWDPLPVPKKFKPTADWPDMATRTAPGSFQDIRVDEIEQPKQVHDFDHYLRNPGVHVPLFRSLLAIPGVISPEEEKSAKDRHRAQFPLSRVKKEIERLKGLRLSDETDDWKQVLTMIHAFFA